MLVTTMNHHHLNFPTFQISNYEHTMSLTIPIKTSPKWNKKNYQLRMNNCKYCKSPKSGDRPIWHGPIQSVQHWCPIMAIPLLEDILNWFPVVQLQLALPLKTPIHAAFLQENVCESWDFPIRINYQLEELRTIKVKWHGTRNSIECLEMQCVLH